MPKKNKHPNLPNGFGSIRKLSGNRRNPYAVHPPVTDYDIDGKPVTPKALCYVSDWYVGFAVLTAYKAGTYTPGMEKELEMLSAMDESNLNLLANRILSDFQIATRADSASNSMFFSELYEKYYDWKFNGKKKYSKNYMTSIRTAYKNCKPIHNKKICEIQYDSLQRIVDNCNLKYSSLELIVLLLKQSFKFAVAQGYLEKNPTELLRINIDDDDEHGIPFSAAEVSKIWNYEENEVAQVLLIMIYSGFRIGELKVVEVNMKKLYFHGGLKTRTSKERTVPIHSAIKHIVAKRIRKNGKLINVSYTTFRDKLNAFFDEIGIIDHTSHDCRHTFSALCEKYEVKENDRKRMLGHKFKDVTNSVYGHRSIEDLRKEIEKIPCLKCVENDSVKKKKKSNLNDAIDCRKMA